MIPGCSEYLLLVWVMAGFVIGSGNEGKFGDQLSDKCSSHLVARQNHGAQIHIHYGRFYPQS